MQTLESENLILMKKNVEEVFNLCSTEQSCILIGITCYKIGTLATRKWQFSNLKHDFASS